MELRRQVRAEMEFRHERKFRIDGWGVTNGVPTGTGGTLPGQTQGGHITPPFVRQR